MPVFLLLAAAGVGLYLLLKEPEVGEPGVAAEGKVVLDMPMPDGTTKRLYVHPQVASGMMMAAGTQDPARMRAYADVLQKGGYIEEAKAMRATAKITEVWKASGGAFAPGVTPAPSPKAAEQAAPELPPDLLKRMQAVLTTQDPADMRRVAAILRQRGYGEAADSLEAAAAVVANLPGAPSVTRPVTPKTPLPTPTVVTPRVLPRAPVPVPARVPAPATTARRRAADALVRHLTVAAPAKRKEDKGLVRAYQSTAGLTTDGLYGPGTAKSLASPESGGHVPPPPRYWPKRRYGEAARQYESWLALQGINDPAREAEWSAARATARKYYP